MALLVKLNAPCWITLSRLVLIPVALLPVYLQWPHGFLIAAFGCIVAGITDVLDGYLARKNHSTTPLGGVLDLLADKLFVAVMLLFLTLQSAIPFWVPGIVILREGVISMFRFRRFREQQPIESNKWGKAKMVVTMVAITGVLLREYIHRDGLPSLPGVLPYILAILDLAWWVMLAAVALTLFSGVNYLIGNISWSMRTANLLGVMRPRIHRTVLRGLTRLATTLGHP